IILTGEPVTKFRRFGRLLAATTVFATIVVGAPVAFAQEDHIVDFSVTNITDFHGHLSSQDTDAPDANSEMGAAKLKALIEYVNQDQEYIMTTSGDNVGGSAIVSAIADDEPTLDVLNILGVDVSAVGNHEFDRGYDDLLGRIVEKSDYPVLGRSEERRVGKESRSRESRYDEKKKTNTEKVRRGTT